MGGEVLLLRYSSSSSSEKGIGEMASLVSCSAVLCVPLRDGGGWYGWMNSVDSSEMEKDMEGRGAEEMEGYLVGATERIEREEEEAMEGLLLPSGRLMRLVRTLGTPLLELATEGGLGSEFKMKRSWSEKREGPCGSGGRGTEGGREGGGFCGLCARGVGGFEGMKEGGTGKDSRRVGTESFRWWGIKGRVSHCAIGY